MVLIKKFSFSEMCVQDLNPVGASVCTCEWVATCSQMEVGTAGSVPTFSAQVDVARSRASCEFSLRECWCVFPRDCTQVPVTETYTIQHRAVKFYFFSEPVFGLLKQVWSRLFKSGVANFPNHLHHDYDYYYDYNYYYYTRLFLVS